MTTEVLDQLRVLRESIAETLRKDPRYLTLAALDRSIAEISAVLGAAGIPTPPAQSAALPFEAPATSPTPPAAIAPVAPAAAAPTPAAVPTPALSAAAPSPTPPAAAPAAPDKVKKKKKSLLKPLVETAAVLAAAGVAAEVVHESRKAAAPKKDESGEDGDKDEDPASKAPAEPDEAEDKTAVASAAEEAADADDDKSDDASAKKQDDDTTEAADGEGAGSVIPKGKAGGYVPMQAKAGATQYQPSISVKFGKLPNKVDLRPLMTPIEDQGETSSCVANAVAGAYEYWIKKALKQDQNISRLFVYYNARWRDNSQDKDDGSVIQLAMEGLAKFGACHEKVWPFDTHLVLKKPGAEAYQDAAPFKVQDMAQVPLKLEAWKQALAEGKPIVFGIALFDSFDECSKRGGVVPMPSPEDVARATHSGHSMCAVGYSDSEKVFIVRNSWGTDWGDKGYCYMPYAYLMNPKFNDADSWVFVPKVPSQPPREVWSDDTTPVTNSGEGVTFPIETYTIEDYAHVAVDLFEKVRRPFNTHVAESFSEYVSFASQGLWSRMEQFDFRTFLASTVALTGISSIIASEFSNTASASESSSESTSLLSESETSEDETSDEDQDEDEQQDEDEEQDEDQDSDEEEDSESEEEESDDDEDESDDDNDDSDDDESEDDDDESEDGDDDGSDDESEDSDESEDGDAEGDDDEDSDDEDSDDEDDADGEEAGDEESDDESDDDESEDDDSDEDDSEDDESDDDDGGDDDGGDDDSGGDDD